MCACYNRPVEVKRSWVLLPSTMWVPRISQVLQVAMIALLPELKPKSHTSYISLCCLCCDLVFSSGLIKNVWPESRG